MRNLHHDWIRDAVLCIEPEIRLYLEAARKGNEQAISYVPLRQAGGFEAVWEPDVFGKFRRELEAATYTAESLADARNWVLVTVAADVARAYLDMRALQRQLAILRKNVDVAKATKNRDSNKGSPTNSTQCWQSGIWRPCDQALRRSKPKSPQASTSLRFSLASIQKILPKNSQSQANSRRFRRKYRPGYQSICYAGGRTSKRQNANLLRPQRTSASQRPISFRSLLSVAQSAAKVEHVLPRQSH